MMSGVLDGIRVIDFGRFIAGPYCGMLLGDLGAEVIRIEKREGSEDRCLSPLADTGEGGMFLQLNRNKKCLTVNPGSPQGREIVKKLVKTADVVIANMPLSVLQKLGLDYDSLRQSKPNIILAMGSAFGSQGPYAERVGFDGVGQAMGGLTYLSGLPGQPIKTMANYVDFGTALSLTVGVLAALLHRRETGEGQLVEGALLRTALNISNGVLIEQALTQINRVPTGNLGQTAGPADIYVCKDGHALLVQVVGPSLFKRWACMIGEEEIWLTDPRFKDDESRGKHGAVLSERMTAWCAERTRAEAIAELDRARVPCGPVYKPQEALEDEHIQASGWMQPVDFPGLPAPAPVMQAPVGLSKTPTQIRRRAPVLGEHTDELLAALGYSAEELAALRADKVI